MPYPDNFNDKAFESRWGSIDDICPCEVRRLDSIHSIWRDTLQAFASSCIKRKIFISRHDLAIAMEGIAEALADEASDSLKAIRAEGVEASYTPADSEKLLVEAWEHIADSFKPKHVSSDELLNSLRQPRPLSSISTSINGAKQ